MLLSTFCLYCWEQETHHLPFSFRPLLIQCEQLIINGSLCSQRFLSLGLLMALALREQNKGKKNMMSFFTTSNHLIIWCTFPHINFMDICQVWLTVLLVLSYDSNCLDFTHTAIKERIIMYYWGSLLVISLRGIKSLDLSREEFSKCHPH